MKEAIITAAVLTALAASAGAYSTGHLWAKVSQFEGQTGKTYCQWECRVHGDIMTTGGYGYCPRPF